MGFIMRKRKSNILGTKSIVTAIAVAAILSNATTTFAVSKSAANNTYKVTTLKNYKNQSDKNEMKVSIPKIGGENSNAVASVNKSIEDYINALVKQHEEDINNAEGFGSQSLTTTYEVITNNNNLLSIRLDTTISMGGSDSFSKIYHIDKQTDSELVLSNLFKKKTDYVTTLSNLVKEQMREQMKADDSLVYFIDSEDMPELDFNKIKKDQTFYIKDNSLVLVFDKYETAPGYMGVVEISIPTDDIQSILNEKGASLL